MGKDSNNMTMLLSEPKIKVKLGGQYAKSLSVKDRRTGRTWVFIEEEEKSVPAHLAFQLMGQNWFTITPDPLKDYDLVARHTGTVGDSVCEAFVLQNWIKNNGGKVILCSNLHIPLVKKIAPDIEVAKSVGSGQMYVDFFTQAIIEKPLYNRNGFEWENNFAKAVDFKEYPNPYPILFTKDEIFSLEQIVPRKKKHLITIHLWSTHSRSKSYNPQKVSELVKRVSGLFNADIILLGGTEKVPYGDISGVIDLRGKTTLLQAAIAVYMSDVILSIDSWIWHMAKLLLKPQVVMFGSTKCAGKPKWWEIVEILEGHLQREEDHPDSFSSGNSSIIDSITIEEVLSALSTIFRRAKKELPKIKEKVQQISE